MILRLEVTHTNVCWLSGEIAIHCTLSLKKLWFQSNIMTSFCSFKSRVTSKQQQSLLDLINFPLWLTWHQFSYQPQAITKERQLLLNLIISPAVSMVKSWSGYSLFYFCCCVRLAVVVCELCYLTWWCQPLPELRQTWADEILAGTHLQ